MLISSLPTVNVTPDTLDTAALYANLSKSILYVRHQTVGNALKLCSWKIAFSINKKRKRRQKEKETGMTTFFLSGLLASDSQWDGCMSEGKA